MVCHDVDWLQERHGWPGLAAVGERHLGDSAASVGARYYLLSAKPTARVSASAKGLASILAVLRHLLDELADEIDVTGRILVRTVRGAVCERR